MLLKQPVVHCRVNTRRNDHWCTFSSSEGREAELTLLPEELCVPSVHRDNLEGYSHLSVPCVSVGYPSWPPWDTLRGRPATRLCWTPCPWPLIPTNPKQQQALVFRKQTWAPAGLSARWCSVLTTALIRSLLTALELWGPANRCNVWEFRAFQLIPNIEQLFHETSLSGWEENSMAPFLIDREKIKGSGLLNNL